MKKWLLFSVLLASVGFNVEAAVPQQRRGSASAQTATTTSSARSSTVAARSATTARSATPASTPAVSARAATTGRTTVNRGTTSSSATPGVAARAATTKSVIGSGTKVATATENVIVSEACRQKYMGCMDSFCMLDNDTGGRCICSDRNAELDSVLAEIEKLDQQSYQMATVGVERIEMGDGAEAAMANANAVADAILNAADKKEERKLDLSLWDTTLSFADEDIFAEADSLQSAIEGKEGDNLYRAASDICMAQIPECSSELAMLQLMYSQQIKSDCTAYENSLKQQKNASAQKLAAAEKALRDAALEQYQSANKYDLGQCTVEFKNCMITTGGCGEDFANCASVAASDNTNVTQSTSKKTKSYKIQGAVTSIEISASTYDTLVAKKPLCESVTKSCVAVADQVWDTFLREAAPQIKSAELIAENNARQNCIGSISECFQKACKDNIDPNDPEGSYDMCLTRPETMLNVCKIPLNACGIDASSAEKASQSQIWDFVVARLASMRVDSCTTQVKECLQSEDRCGSDYTQCVGLDTDTIVRMCPYDSLVGCQMVYGEDEIRGDAVYDELANMVQGIMLNIDNSMLTECQNAANEAMIKVCGSTENCDNLTVDENIGARSLEYKICEYTNSEDSLDIDYARCRTDASQIMDTELGRVQGALSAGLGAVTPFAGVIDGTIYWESVDFDDDGKLISVDEYLDAVGAEGVTEQQKEKISSELAVLQSNINAAISAIEADPTVQYCMTGREVQGMRTSQSSTRQVIGRSGANEGRFPELTKQMRLMIATSALKAAKDNYYKKYDELSEKMLQDYVDIGERMAEIEGENALDARREIARVACINFADASILPKSPNPPKSAFGKVLGALAFVGAAVAAPFTGGLSLTATIAIGAGLTGTAAIGLLGNAGSGGANGADSSLQRELIGLKSLNQWNYKETITATFEWDTLVCHKCVRSQQCSKTKNPLFGSKYCKSWADPVETCNDTQF